MKNMHIMNPYCLGQDAETIFAKLAFCKGGGGSSNAEYERQLEEQRKATEKAEREAAKLKKEANKHSQLRKDRQAAALLTSGGGEGDETVNVRKTLLGSGS